MSISNSNVFIDGLKHNSQNITLDLTEECNLNCSYCFTQSIHDKKVIDIDLAKQIIDYWLRAIPINDKPKEFTFWGGEPLLEWNMLKELVNYIQTNKGNQKILIGVVSNGVLYTEEKVKWCKDNKIQILISMDGLQHIHDSNRIFKNNKGSWNIVDKNLRNAIKTNKRIIIINSVTPELAPYFLETLKYYVEDLGIKMFIFNPIYEANWNVEDFNILEDQYLKVIEYIKKKKIIKIKPFDHNIKETFLNSCGAANVSSSWGIDGFNYPCFRFNKHGLTLSEKFNSKTILGHMKDGKYVSLNNNFRGEFLNSKNNFSDKCKECEIYGTSVCNGGCYALNYDLTEDIHGIVDNQCKMKKILYKINKLYKRIKEDKK